MEIYSPEKENRMTGWKIPTMNEDDKIRVSLKIMVDFPAIAIFQCKSPHLFKKTTTNDLDLPPTQDAPWNPAWGGRSKLSPGLVQLGPNVDISELPCHSMIFRGHLEETPNGLP